MTSLLAQSLRSLFRPTASARPPTSRRVFPSYVRDAPDCLFSDTEFRANLLVEQARDDELRTSNSRGVSVSNLDRNESRSVRSP